MKSSVFSLALLLLNALMSYADGVRPLRFGPFLQQSIAFEGSPTGYAYVPPSATYNFQAGWMEPIGFLPRAVFHGAYLETQANATLSPYQSDLGVIINFKPIRFLEGGVGYNRLLFPYTLLGFSWPAGAGNGWVPSVEQWRTTQISSGRKNESVGADIFTYQANFTMDVGKVQLHAGAFRSLWDVDVQDRDVVLEYRSGLLIQRRDRINSTYAQMLLKLDPTSEWLGFRASGFEIRDQYWWVTHTGLTQNIVSAVLSGLRRGRNNDRAYHGLDILIGGWTDHPQFEGHEWWTRLYLNLRWTWNIQILHLGED